MHTLSKYSAITILSMLANLTSASTLESLKGNWTNECYEGYPEFSFITHKNNNYLEIAVAPSQIHINAIAKSSNEGYSLFFISTDDLGRGGMNYNWSDIDKEHRIAKITNLKNKQYSLQWFGFHYKSSGERLNMPEFSDISLMKECKHEAIN